jgi:hypothetical protein
MATVTWERVELATTTVLSHHNDIRDRDRKHTRRPPGQGQYYITQAVLPRLASLRLYPTPHV